ncbi:hypothetical protein GQ54DRAFT_258661 [Martensiomyces pterosporus]|nr:hypothetical protein GQ54DRAFT_258661 [Martensiomyces pterosporus]
MLCEFDKSIRNRDITQAWYLYSRLLQRSKKDEEKLEAQDPLLEGKVVPRRLAKSPKLRVHALHSKLLSVLNLKGVRAYNSKFTEQLTERIKRVLSTVAAEGGELSAGDLNHLLAYFASVKNDEAVDHVWQYAALSGMPRDITNYNAYVNAKIVIGQYEQALEAAREIRQVGLQPNTYTQACLIRLYGLTGDLQAARRVFNFVCSSAAGASSQAERHLARAHARVQYWQNAVDDLHLCGPNVYVYNEMLEVYGMNGLVDDMDMLLWRMLGMGEHVEMDQITAEAVEGARAAQTCKPNRKTFHTMIKWHATYWDLKTAAKYMELMQIYGITPNAATFKLMITKDTAVRDLQTCGELALAMTTKYGIPPIRSVVNTLEVAAKKVKSMDEMIREAETQRSTLFPSLSLDGLSLAGTSKEEKVGERTLPSHT